MSTMWMAIAGVVLLAVGAALGSMWTHRQLLRHVRLTNSQLSKLSGDLEMVNSGAVGMGQRLLAVEKKLNITVEKQQELANYQAGHIPYSQAAKLMEMGASAGDLVERCGLSKAEAELMSLLHRQIQPPGPTHH